MLYLLGVPDRMDVGGHGGLVERGMGGKFHNFVMAESCPLNFEESSFLPISSFNLIILFEFVDGCMAGDSARLKKSNDFWALL